MNYDTLYHLVEGNIFTDLTLVLTDGTNKLTDKFHKNILYASSPYFEKILSADDSMTHITAIVPNIYVSYDIIMSFYKKKSNIKNLPEWHHVLELFRCNDFFGIKNDDLSILLNKNVPPEGFELLLDVVKVYGYNKLIAEIIVNSLPASYDVTKFPPELFNKMLEISTTYNIISGSDDQSIRIWNLATGGLLRVLDEPAHILCSASNSKQIIIGYDHSIKILDIETEQSICTLIDNFDESRAHCYGIRSVCYSPDNKQIAFGNDKNDIKIFHTDTGELVHTLSGHIGLIGTLCYASNGKQLVSGSDDCTIKIWNTETGQLIRTIFGHTGEVNTVCYSPDDSEIVSCSDDHSIKIWNAESGQLLRIINAHTDLVQHICYSPNNKYMASASSDHTIKIFNAKNTDLIRTLNGHVDAVTCICFSPDSRYVISGCSDASIKIWNIETGQLMHTMTGHTSDIHSIFCVECPNYELMERFNYFPRL
jgi:WD40 repeat protein